MNYLRKMYCVLALMSVQHAYSKWDVKKLEKNDAGQVAHGVKELSKLSLLGTERVLDVGCRAGKISQIIAQEYVPNGHVDAIDKNPEMISLAQELTDQKNITFACKDIYALTSGKKYDVVTSFWSLHWEEDYEQAIQGIAQATAEKGQALLCHVVGDDPLNTWAQRILEQDKWRAYKLQYKKNSHAPSLEKVVQAVSASGLSIEHFEVKKNGQWMPFEVAQKNILSMPLFSFMPEEKREEFCADVMKGIMSEVSVASPGQFYYSLPVAVLSLKKNKNSGEKV